MMKLKNVSRYFDDTIAADAYDLEAMPFRCQIEPFDYWKIDGAQVMRRVMSTAPEVELPSRGVIRIGSDAFIVGRPAEDYWKAESIRRRYVIQGAGGLAEIQTIAQVLADQPGVRAYASVDFNKYGTDERDSSEYHPQYHIYFAASESVVEDNVIVVGSTYYFVRNAHRTVSGLLDALSNVIDSPVIDTATFSSQAYDPITDTYTNSDETVRCMRLRWQEHFEHLSISSAKFVRGDAQVLVPLSVTPKGGDTITLTDGPWRVLSHVDRADYRMLHVRRD